ncbi:MAG: hypothetical protein WC082_04615 [Victivallales bacterium]
MDEATGISRNGDIEFNYLDDDVIMMNIEGSSGLHLISTKYKKL